MNSATSGEFRYFQMFGMSQELATRSCNETMADINKNSNEYRLSCKQKINDVKYNVN